MIFAMFPALEARCVHAEGLCLLAVLFVLSMPVSAQDQLASPPVIQVNPPRFGFFAKMVNCDGIAVRGPAEIQDTSLQIACRKIRSALHNAPAIRQRLAAEGAELQLIAMGQNFNQLPGHQADPPPPALDEVRANNLYGTCSEKNLLAHESSTGAGIDACFFALGQIVMLGGLTQDEQGNVDRQYRAAKEARLWKGSTLVVNAVGYWGELSVWYFGKSGHSPTGMNIAAGPDAMRAYDPGGFEVLDKIYSGREKPPEIHLTNSRQISSAQSSVTSETHGEIVIANDTEISLRFTRISTWPNGLGLTEPTGTNTRLIMPFDRRIFPTGNNDIWVVADLKGRELGRFTPAGPASYLHIGK